MRWGLLLLTWLIFTGCASRISRTTLVLAYADFGPQAMAYKVLGPKNYQWDPHTPIPLGEDGVKVVVFRGIDLEEVQGHYPVDRERGIDYRYLPYADALEYLDARIRQNLLKRITIKLQETREQLVAHLE